MLEDVSSSELNNNSKEKLNSPNIKANDKAFNFSPIDELELLLDKGSNKDREEIIKILGEYLNYPSTELATLHSDAMKLGNFDLEQKDNLKNSKLKNDGLNEKAKLCPCCGFMKQEDTIKICTSFDDIKNMGTSTYLYFSTFKNLSVMLGILTIIYSIYSIITNVIAAKKNTNGSTYTVDYLTISLSSKETNDTTQNRLFYFIQCILGAVTMLIWILVLIGIKYFELKSAQEYDQDTISISDYSVVIEGIPLDVKQDELQKQFNAYYDAVTKFRRIPESRKKPFNIVKLNIGKPFYLSDDALRDEELQKIEKQIKQIKEEFVKWIQERQSKPSFTESKEKRDELYAKFASLQKKRIEKYLEITKKIKDSLKSQSADQLTTAFVTFDTNYAKNLMVYLNEITWIGRLKGICGQDENRFVYRKGEDLYSLDIKRAPEPEDIIWTNLGQRDCVSYGRKFFTFTITAVLLGACFAAVYGLSQAQKTVEADKNDSNSRYLSIAISITISVVNIILGQAIRFLTLFERDYTSTNHQASLAIKSIMAQMINSILIPVIIAYYIKDANIYQTSGLVDNIFMMSITNSLVPPILLFFDPYNLFMKIKRSFKSRAGSKLYQTQKDHNQLHEGLQFEVGFEYLYVVNLFMFVCFFVSLQPIVAVIALIGYLLMYWVQKYCLFNRYKRPVPGTDFINKAVYQIIYMGPLIYSLGSLTWSNFSPNGIPPEALIPNLVSVGFSVILLVVPFQSIIVACCFSENSDKLTKYEENRLFFPTEYDRSNPTTQEEGIEDYAKFMEKKKEQLKGLSKEKQQQIAQKMLNNAQRGQMNQANVTPPFMGTALQNTYSYVQPPPMAYQFTQQFMPVAPAYMPYQPMAPQVPMGYAQPQMVQPRPAAYGSPQPMMAMSPSIGGFGGFGGFGAPMGFQQPSFNSYSPFGAAGFRPW